MSEGEQKHRAFITIWRYGRVSENHHAIAKYQHYRGVSVGVMFYFWQDQIFWLRNCFLIC